LRRLKSCGAWPGFSTSSAREARYRPIASRCARSFWAGFPRSLAGAGSLGACPDRPWSPLDRQWGLRSAAASRIVRAVVGRWLRGPRTHYLFENRDDPAEFGPEPADPQVTIVAGARRSKPGNFPVTPEPPSPPLKLAVVARMLRSKGIAEAVEATRARAASRRAGGTRHFRRARSVKPGVDPGSGTAAMVVAAGDCLARNEQRCRAGLARASRRDFPHLLSGRAGPNAGGSRPRPAPPHHRKRRGRAVARSCAMAWKALLVPSGDVDAAARAIVTLAADPALRAQLGAAANRRFLERLTEDGGAAGGRRTVPAGCHPARGQAKCWTVSICCHYNTRPSLLELGDEISRWRARGVTSSTASNRGRLWPMVGLQDIRFAISAVGHRSILDHAEPCCDHHRRLAFSISGIFQSEVHVTCRILRPASSFGPTSPA